MDRPYLFGDSEPAARRLELLARLFRPSTHAFIAEIGNARFDLAVDLGCGPGFTTHLIAETLRCDRVLGLDASPRFVELAQRTATARVSFVAHDVCAIPFPGGPADLIFCRYLLTHLENPAAMVARWATQLRAGGMLLIDEVEAIRTAHPVFTRYLEIVQAMLANQRNCLYAGPIVGALDAPAGLSTLRTDLRPAPMSNSDAAQMFHLNMQAWKDGNFVRSNYDAAAMRDLEETLQRLGADHSPRSEIEWTMRQTVFHRS